MLFLASLLFGFPLGGESDLTGGLAFVFNFHPQVHLGFSAESGNLAATITDLLVFALVFVEDLVVDVITKILDVDLEVLVVPFGLLGSVSIGLRLPDEFTADNLDVGVHLSELLDIVGEVRFLERHVELA